MKKIALIGSTGSIGTQVLNCVRRHKDKFEIVSLSAGSNASVFLQQVNEFKPKVATLIDGKAIDKSLLPKETEFFFGEDAFTNAIIKECDIVVISLVGFKGIIAVLDAIDKKKNIALANKESLVVGGKIVMEKAKENGVSIVPIDSEHSAIWQALNFDFDHPFRRIILTASGGAFRDYSLKELEKATSKDALKHPNWSMGNKITIDCATLVNKGFEVIEAKWLYHTSFDKINVIIHRESIIHSMVEMNDSSVIAQMSYPSMELPIQLALTYPERFDTEIKSLDFASLTSLTFTEPDNERFPCLNLIIKAGKQGGLSTTIANGANEEAVKLFLQNRIKFNDIYRAIASSLDNIPSGKIEGFSSLLETDKKSREFVKKMFGE